MHAAGFSGHANYCAANASMDAIAAHNAARGLPDLAVQWGAWSSTGVCLKQQLVYATCIRWMQAYSI